jgi:hypothetical protein
VKRNAYSRLTQNNAWDYSNSLFSLLFY